jgi:hypothetical protein
LKQQKRATNKPSTTIAKMETPAPPTEQPVPLATRLQDIRSEALRDRSHTSKLIASLQTQREQLEEMRNEIDATVAFLRAQRNK